jgi:hypothetical protein
MIITLQTITIVRAGTKTDRYGNTVADWSTATRRTADRVSVQPSSQTETPAGNRDPVITVWRILSDHGVDIDVLPPDRIEWDGATFEVAGEVGRFRDPFTGGVDHVEFAMRKVMG